MIETFTYFMLLKPSLAITIEIPAPFKAGTTPVEIDLEGGTRPSAQRQGGG